MVVIQRRISPKVTLTIFLPGAKDPATLTFFDASRMRGVEFELRLPAGGNVSFGSMPPKERPRGRPPGRTRARGRSPSIFVDAPRELLESIARDNGDIRFK
ncbi:hypothetical protein HYW67_03515 [Candidatus Parcubacteria bacterium]|nr:hypothetical protein [Candidatus Parcubacteria bacterium]